jgi:hypothetical protein
MDSIDVSQCPYCQSQLESGYLGYTSGLFWSSQRLNWWQSLFFVACSYGRFVVGDFVSTPWFRSRAAHRCVSCGALVIPTDRQHTTIRPGQN